LNLSSNRLTEKEVALLDGLQNLRALDLCKIELTQHWITSKHRVWVIWRSSPSLKVSIFKGANWKVTVCLLFLRIFRSWKSWGLATTDSTRSGLWGIFTSYLRWRSWD